MGSSLNDSYETVIGLECHVQLSTKTKLFSPAENRFGASPNELVDIIDLGLPGVLPVVNRRAIDFAIKLGLALNCEIRKENVFARKHYFYPDLPKGYQISQFDKPICEHGKIKIETSLGDKWIGITRIHMEEDAGKNVHDEESGSSFVDFNRAGAPLLEVVTEPDFRTSEEAAAFVKALRSIVTYLGVGDGNMQEGSLRTDVNVSVRKKGRTELGTRTETKNLNSFRYISQAIEYERRRQILEIEDGNSIKLETRLWDPNQKASRSMRSKEEAHDYRYFPDPDLLPVMLTGKEIEDIRSTMPELPAQKRRRFQEEFGLSPYDAGVLTSEKALATYFEDSLATHNNAKGIANWIINGVLAHQKEDPDAQKRTGYPIPPENIGLLVSLIDQQVISGKIAKSLFAEMVLSPKQDPKEIVRRKGWQVQNDSSALMGIISEIIEAHPLEREKYLAGKQQLFGFFMGQIMKVTQGQADPRVAKGLLEKSLKKLEPQEGK